MRYIFGLNAGNLLLHLTHCLHAVFFLHFCRLQDIFFSKKALFKTYFKLSNSLDPDQGHFVDGLGRKLFARLTCISRRDLQVQG